MDADDLLACLEHYRDQHGVTQVWGGRKKGRAPDDPPPADDPEVRWWCDHVGLDGRGRPWRGGPPIAYGGASGWDILEACLALERAGRIRRVRRRGRSYFELLDA